MDLPPLVPPEPMTMQKKLVKHGVVNTHRDAATLLFIFAIFLIAGMLYFLNLAVPF